MSSEFNPTETATQETVIAGLQTRDMKWMYMMELEKMVRYAVSSSSQIFSLMGLNRKLIPTKKPAQVAGF